MQEILSFRSKAGLRHTIYEREDGTIVDASSLDVTVLAGILEQNQAMATHNDGYTPSREMARIASIPLPVIYKWMTENPGFDPFSSDPDCQKKLCQLLDDPQWRYLRTSEIVLGDHWRHSI